MCNVSLYAEDTIRDIAGALRDDLLPLLRRYAESGSPDVVTYLLAVAISAGLQAEALQTLATVKNEKKRLCPDHDQNEVAEALNRAAQWAAVIAVRYSKGSAQQGE